MASNITSADSNPIHCCHDCKDAYQDPRILSCLHMFSIKCLKEQSNEGDVLICPTCGCQTPIPPTTGIEGLQCQVRLNREDQYKQILSSISNVPPYCNSCDSDTPKAVCMDCEDQFLCDACWSAHQQLKKSRSHYSFLVSEVLEMTPDQLLKALPVSYTSPLPDCKEHRGQKVDLFCQKCSALICLKCSVLSHKGHNVQEIKKYASQCRRILGHTLDKMTKAHSTLSELSTSISVTTERMKTRREELDSTIKQSFAQLFQLLHEREELLSFKINEVADAKESTLITQKENIEKLLQPFADICSLGSAATSEYTDIELLSIARTIEERAISLQETFSETPLELSESSNIPAEIDNESLATTIKEFGRISNISSSNSIAVLPRRSVTLGAEMSIAVIPMDSKKRPVEDAGAVVSSYLICPNKEKIKCPVSSNDDGTYSVSVKPMGSGGHDLVIAIHSQPICGSPFSITVAQRREYEKVKKPLKIISGIEYPKCIAFAPNGDMFITSDNHCVYIYDTNGKRKTTIGSQGSGQLQFQSPHGIAINHDEVYVAEYGGDRIHKFTTSGSFLSTFGEHGDEIGCFSNPHDVKISPNGKIFVADTDNCRIQVFDLDWSIVSVIDGKNISGGSFKGPMGLAFNLLGNLVITEHECHSLTVLSQRGHFIRKFEHGSNLNYPAGIAIDGAGYILVVNYNPGSLSIFDENGKFVHSVRGFSYPFGIDVSPEGCVWVADYYNKRLVKY